MKSPSRGTLRSRRGASPDDEKDTQARPHRHAGLDPGSMNTAAGCRSRAAVPAESISGGLSRAGRPLRAFVSLSAPNPSQSGDSAKAGKPVFRSHEVHKDHEGLAGEERGALVLQPAAASNPGLNCVRRRDCTIPLCLRGFRGLRGPCAKPNLRTKGAPRGRKRRRFPTAEERRRALRGPKSNRAGPPLPVIPAKAGIHEHGRRMSITGDAHRAGAGIACGAGVGHGPFVPSCLCVN
jgi:hypothetical protein